MCCATVGNAGCGQLQLWPALPLRSDSWLCCRMPVAAGWGEALPRDMAQGNGGKSREQCAGVSAMLPHRSLPDCERMSRPGLIGELRSQPLLRGGLKGSSLVRLKGGSCKASLSSMRQEAVMSAPTGISRRDTLRAP